MKHSTMTLAEAHEKLVANIKAPFVRIELSTNLCDSIYIAWSMTPKEEWSNRIFENGKCGKFHIFLKRNGRDCAREVDSDGTAEFRVSYNRSDKNIRNVKTPMPLDKLVDKVIKMFA